jgi:hypothetical protein
VPGRRSVWVKDRDDALEPVTLREGRHCAATAGSAAGLDDLTLAHVTGHTNESFRRSQYGHVRPDHIAAAAKLLDTYSARPAARERKSESRAKVGTGVERFRADLSGSAQHARNLYVCRENRSLSGIRPSPAPLFESPCRYSWKPAR